MQSSSPAQSGHLRPAVLFLTLLLALGVTPPSAAQAPPAGEEEGPLAPQMASFVGAGYADWMVGQTGHGQLGVLSLFVDGGCAGPYGSHCGHLRYEDAYGWFECTWTRDQPTATGTVVIYGTMSVHSTSQLCGGDAWGVLVCDAFGRLDAWRLGIHVRVTATGICTSGLQG